MDPIENAGVPCSSANAGAGPCLVTDSQGKQKQAVLTDQTRRCLLQSVLLFVSLCGEQTLGLVIVCDESP